MDPFIILHFAFCILHFAFCIPPPSPQLNFPTPHPTIPPMPVHRYEFFSSTDAARMGKLQFMARQVVEGVITGLHRSPHRGFSVEFSEHREVRPRR